MLYGNRCGVGADIVCLTDLCFLRIDGDDAKRHRQIGVAASDAYIVDRHVDGSGLEGYIRHLGDLTFTVHEVDLAVLVGNDELIGLLVVRNMRHG